jgi:hypothetical protein
MYNPTHHPRLFYDMMNYPLPPDKHFFASEKMNDKWKEEKIWLYQRWPLHDKYMQVIKSNKRFFESIPFCKAIYLCNSLTFNALHNGSDIDLFIVVQSWKIWTVRLFSWFLAVRYKIKRTKTIVDKQLCLSFYITDNHLNLYPLSLPKGDIYLAYWIAHLAVIRHDPTWNPNKIFEENKRIKWYLPNHPLKQIILKKQIPRTNKNTQAKQWEKKLSGIRWTIIEQIIKIIRYPIVITKKTLLWKQWRGVIISDSILKFHWDQRKKIQFKRKQYCKKYW